LKKVARTRETSLQLSAIKLRGSLRDCLVSLASLVLVLDDVLLLELTHALDLVKVDNKALVVAMQRLDALSTENVQMV